MVIIGLGLDGLFVEVASAVGTRETPGVFWRVIRVALHAGEERPISLLGSPIFKDILGL